MDESPFHTELDIPVPGGNLRVGVAGAPPGRAPAVLAVHGITGSHRSWVPVARHLGRDVTVLAPDLRGRGASAGLPGPHGLDAHVDDLVAVLEAVGVSRAVLAGHSMGGYVVARLAATQPTRARSVVLVDGGLPLVVPFEGDPDALIDVVLGPAIARLRMSFPTCEAYRDFWKAHPAFSRPGAWTADVCDYVDYDLVGTEPELRSRVEEAAVRADGRDVLDGDRARGALAALRCPVVLLRAPRGLLDEPSPLLPDEVVRASSAVIPQLVDLIVTDTNHYLIAMGQREAATVAQQIRAACAG